MGNDTVNVIVNKFTNQTSQTAYNIGQRSHQTYLMICKKRFFVLFDLFEIEESGMKCFFFRWRG